MPNTTAYKDSQPTSIAVATAIAATTVPAATTVFLAATCKNFPPQFTHYIKQNPISSVCVHFHQIHLMAGAKRFKPEITIKLIAATSHIILDVSTPCHSLSEARGPEHLNAINTLCTI